MDNKIFGLKSYSRQQSPKYSKYFELDKMDKNVVVRALLELKNILSQSSSGQNGQKQ